MFGKLIRLLCFSKVVAKKFIVLQHASIARGISNLLWYVQRLISEGSHYLSACVDGPNSHVLEDLY